MNLYGFVKNDGVSNFDILGLWTPIKREGGRWAETCAEKGDTWNDLALATDLDLSEPSKWVKGYDGSHPTPGTIYSVPNVFSTYITGTGWWSVDDKWIPDWWNAGLGILGVFRDEVARLERHYGISGYKIVSHHGAMSGKTFQSIWKEDGIAALAFAGHGYPESLGFLAGDSDDADNIVDSQNVKPPYKLSLIGAFSCYSRENDWRVHLSSYGVMYEYTGVASLFLNACPTRTDLSPDGPHFPPLPDIIPFPF